MKIAAAEIETPKTTSAVSDPTTSGSVRRYKQPSVSLSETRMRTSVEVKVTSSVDNMLLNKLSSKVELHSFSQQVRSVDKTMALINEHLKTMRESLEHITKMFPPYPQDNIERLQALRQFSTLRKMIDRLTFPPSDDASVKILGDKKRSAEVADWEVSLNNGGDKIIIGRQPVHAEAGGLNLPDIPDTAPDAALRHALDSLDESAKILRRRREDFATDVNQIFTLVP